MARSASRTDDRESRRKRRSSRQRHLLDHVSIIRAHAPWGLAAAALLFSFLAWRALQKPSVYRSDAILHLDVQGDSGEGSVVSPMAAFSRVSTVQPELATIMSRQLAEKAVTQHSSLLRVRVSDTSAYKPFDSLLRRFRGGSSACHISARTDGPFAEPLAAKLRVKEDPNGTQYAELIRKVGGKETIDTISPFAFGEPWTDSDRDGHWDAPELWEDLDGDGVFTPGEPYRDANLNGRWDAREAFTDVDGDGSCDAEEPYTDANGNGRFDPGDENYDDVDGDGHWDAAEPYIDADGNQSWRRYDEPYVDLDGDGRFDPGDTWVDEDRDGRWDAGEPFADTDQDGVRAAGTPLQLDERRVHLLLMSGSPQGKTFDLRASPDPRAAAILNSLVGARAIEEYSGVVRVRASAGTPYLARDAVEAIVYSYLDLKQEQKEEKAARLLAFLKAERKRVDRQLREAQRQHDDFVERSGAVMLTERVQAAYGEAGTLVRERLELSFKRRMMQDTIAGLNQVPASDPSDLLTLLDAERVDPRTSSLVDQVTELERDIGGLRAKLGPGRTSKELEHLEEALSQTRSLLRNSAAKLARERRKQFEAEVANIDAQLRELRRQEERQRSLTTRLPRIERQRLLMQRPVQELEATRSEIQRYIKDTEVAKASSLSAARLIDAPRLMPARVSPNLVQEFLIALVLSIAAGIGVCFLREYLDNKIKNPTQLEDTIGLPVYATIPVFDGVKRKDRPRKGRLVAFDRPKSLLSEAYRSLRSSVRNENRDAPVRTLAITSPTKTEGKSITTCNLAATFALAGDSALVIDADLRRPSTHTYVGGARSPGLVEVLEDGVPWRDVVRPGPTPGLTFLHAGRSSGNPSALLDSQGFERMLEEAEAQYDYVFIDVPPVLAVADAAAFLHRLDAVLLLVHARRYPMEIAEDAYDRLERAGADVRGVVLNGFDPRRGGAGQGYYGYYGRYYGRYGYGK